MRGGTLYCPCGGKLTNEPQSGEGRKIWLAYDTDQIRKRIKIHLFRPQVLRRWSRGQNATTASTALLHQDNLQTLSA